MNRRHWRAISALSLFCFLTVCPRASAHSPDFSTAKLVARDGGYDLEVNFLASDIDRMLVAARAEQEGGDRSEPLGREEEIGEFVARRIILRYPNGAECRGVRQHTEPQAAQEALVQARLRIQCPGGDRFQFYDATKLIAAQGPRGRHLVEVVSPDNGGQTLLAGDSPPLNLTQPLETTWQVMQRFVIYGIGHILSGFDHLCFLLAVILWATRVWPVVKIVTAFTISHSITLSLAALDILVLPARITESAIALSIVYVAIENFFSRDVERRWRDTFFFGFIHGFGFASGLKELNMQRKMLLPSLASFNIGVEIGQIGIVMLILPLLWLADRATGRRRSESLVFGLSALIAFLGAYWFCLRAFA